MRRFGSKQHAWRRTVLAVVVLVTTSLASGQQGPPAAPVVAGRVEQAKVRATADVVGTILPITESTISSEIAGLVDAVPVKQGDRVKAGQVLCKIKDTELRLLLAEAAARLEALEQTVAELEAGTRKEDLDRLRAAANEAKAVRDKWAREKDRLEPLRKQEIASSKEYLDAVSDWTAAAERYAQARAELAKAVAGPRKEELARAHAEADAQRAVVDQIKDKLDKTSVRAPYSGYVVAKRTEIGQWTTLGGPVVDMLAMDRVLARVDLPENAIAFARHNDPGEVRIDALQRDFVGTVAHIIPRGDPSARTFPVEIEIANPDGVIKPGMFVRAKLPAGPVTPTLIVPKDAVVRYGSARAVYVIRDQVAMAEFVQTGLEQQDQISVMGNLKPGEWVIVRGNERLVPGVPTPVVVTNGTDLAPPTSAPANPTPQGNK